MAKKQSKVVYKEDIPQIVELVTIYARKNSDMFWIASLNPAYLEDKGLVLEGNIAGLKDYLKAKGYPKSK